MKESEVREGDIVEIDYIEEFTKIHRIEGKAIVLWKDSFSHQPLVTKLTEYKPTWRVYDEFSKVVGHIEPREVLNKVIQTLEQEPKTGHWNCGDDMFEYAICSSCKHETGEAWEYAKRNFKYCPNCGARMVEKQESEKNNAK